jgi:RimJ/RimL family protein N-acetyltransferase
VSRLKSIASGIETERFSLKRYNRKEDFDDVLIGWFNDPDIKAAFFFPKKIDKKVILHRIRLFNKNGPFFIIRPHGKDKIGFFNVHLTEHSKIAETAIALGDRSWWGKGVTLELRNAVIDRLFKETDIKGVKGEPASRNIASIFTYKKMGFEFKKLRKLKGVEISQFEITREIWNERNRISS